MQYSNAPFCDTNFLFIENATSDNSQTLHRVLKSRLKSLGLDISKLSGVSTDGASVMVGKRAGLVQRMKADNPALVAIPCICHRLARIDTNTYLQYIKEMEAYMTQIWKIFH